MRFALELQDVGGVTVIVVRGDADLYNSPQIRQRITGEIDGGARRLVVDLSRTTLADSTMLGVLVGALKRVREVDGQLALAGPQQHLMTVFEITGLDRVFAIYDDAAQAIAAIAD